MAVEPHAPGDRFLRARDDVERDRRHLAERGLEHRRPRRDPRGVGVRERGFRAAHEVGRPRALREDLADGGLRFGVRDGDREARVRTRGAHELARVEQAREQQHDLAATAPR